MPIIGLTDTGTSFPQIGILRKGAPKPDAKRPGSDLDHFRFDADDEQAAADFAAAYGEAPRSIRIYLPFDQTDENLSAWKEHWVAGGLVRRCDGQTCVLRQLPNGKGYDATPHRCACTTMPADSRDRCKPVGRLKVIIPELRRLAYVTALTTSIHDIKNLSEQLRALEGVRGTLRGIPMILSRIEREISMPGSDGKRVRRSKWLLAIEAAPHWVSLQLQAQERAALPSGAEQHAEAPAMLALPAPIEPAESPLPPAPEANHATGEVIETSYAAQQLAPPSLKEQIIADVIAAGSQVSKAGRWLSEAEKPRMGELRRMSADELTGLLQTYEERLAGPWPPQTNSLAEEFDAIDEAISAK